MQAPLAVLGFVFGTLPWWQTGDLVWIASAIIGQLVILVPKIFRRQNNRLTERFGL